MVPSEYFHIIWTLEWEARVQAEIGSPGSQGIWEATAALIAIKLWVLPEVKGPIRIAGDAEGVLADLVQLRGKAPVVNEVAKEVALHLAPQGRDLAGLHIWGENNVLSDQRSRVAETQWTARLTWLQQVACDRVVPDSDLLNLRFLVTSKMCQEMGPPLLRIFGSCYYDLKGSGEVMFAGFQLRISGVPLLYTLLGYVSKSVLDQTLGYVRVSWVMSVVV